MSNENTVNGLATMCGIDRRTVERLLAGEPPTLKALVRAMMGRSKGLTKRREELLEAEIELKRIEIGQKHAVLVHIDDLCARLSPRYSAMRSIIQNSRLGDDEKRDLLEQLHRAHSDVTPPPPAPAEPEPAAEGGQ